MATTLPLHQQAKAAGEVPTEEKVILLLSQALVARNAHNDKRRYMYLDHAQEMLMRIMETSPEWAPPMGEQSSPVREIEAGLPE